jgi:hypothetical protein
MQRLHFLKRYGHECFNQAVGGLLNTGRLSKTELAVESGRFRSAPAEPEQGIDGQFNLVSMPRYYEDFGSLICAGLHSKTTFADKA